MGAQNRITKQKFQQIKAELAAPKDYKRVMRKYGISESTARSIRNSSSYEYYRKWVVERSIHKKSQPNKAPTTPKASTPKTRTSSGEPKVIIARIPMANAQSETEKRADHIALLTMTAFMLFFIAVAIAIITLLIKVSAQ